MRGIASARKRARHHTYSILLEILECLRSPVQVGKATGGHCPGPIRTGVACRPEHVGELQHRKRSEAL